MRASLLFRLLVHGCSPVCDLSCSSKNWYWLGGVPCVPLCEMLVLCALSRWLWSRVLSSVWVLAWISGLSSRVLAAWGAGILLLACIGPFVVLQVGPLLRCLTVTWTGIRHLSRVGAPVCLQVGTRGKFVVVFVAGEWLISGMRSPT